MKNKSLVLVAFLIFSTIAGYAGTRNRYEVPVNQLGQGDTYALPCVPHKLVATANTAVTVYGVGKSTPLAEAGVLFWAIVDKAATAGDYIVFRDSATANATATPFLILSNTDTTESALFQFNPPIAVTNGLSIDASTASTGVTVCVRAADGDL